LSRIWIKAAPAAPLARRQRAGLCRWAARPAHAGPHPQSTLIQVSRGRQPGGAHPSPSAPI